MTKISAKNIAEAIYESTEGKSGQGLALALQRSAEILKDKRMLGKSKEILEALQNFIDKRTGTVRAKITTAGKIGPEARSKLEKDLKEKYKAKMVASEYFEKAELLGGARVEVGDEVLDTTYKSKLRELEKFLIK
jgi:F-type H+-transporting ATPase subunit delta